MRIILNNSDIDIAIICDDEDISKKIVSNLSILPLDLHILDFTSKDFSEMLNSREFNVGLEIKKNYIILKVFENYYNIIKDEE